MTTLEQLDVNNRRQVLQESVDKSKTLLKNMEGMINKTETTEKANHNQILAVDPGSTESALVWWNGKNENISSKGILNNYKILEILQEIPDTVHHLPILVIEKVTSYGMPVGASVFDTVFWTGRFYQAWRGRLEMIPRMDVKMHLCHNSRAKDSNIRQALIDRFGPPGTKKAPGLTYGLKKDMWQAFALAVTYYDIYSKNCD